MLNFKNITIIFALIIFSLNLSFADINADLKNRTQELNRLKQNINDKKAEQIRLMKEEKKVKQELQKISSSISETEKQLKLIQRKIKAAEKKLESAFERYSDADRQKHVLSGQIEKDFLFYDRRKLTSYFCCPIEFKFRYLSLRDKSARYNTAQNNEQEAKTNISKYEKEKKEFLDLKSRQQKLAEKNKKLQKDKSNLLKTTAGRRIQAEQDIKALNDSAKALESLVKKIMQASKQEKRITSLRSNGTERKNNLPWPADGTVVLNYGKNKHPDLDTNLISNGIKIKTKNNAIIKSVDDGTVVFTGEFRSYGKIIIINHKDVFFSVYGQLNDILVSENQNVARGGQIAALGSDENAVLYFEIRQYNVPENPKLWLLEKK